MGTGKTFRMRLRRGFRQTAGPSALPQDDIFSWNGDCWTPTLQPGGGLCPPYPYLGAASEASASAYANTVTTAAFSFSSRPSTLSKVSAAVWW
jgi:hypothetical protein